eukprot:TRINITY_DN5689_c0_g4_i1.p1 TRINITY_DN5689_c0_g4~~TRINITY_DN5689_c0_g4_i1.p1  ORF type:complete len:949 (+),score=173.73 TRINITY_DN5689_c0_g4_i1:293-2848(+)
MAEVFAGTLVEKLFWKQRFVDLGATELCCWTAPPDLSGRLLVSLPLNAVDEVAVDKKICVMHCREPQALIHFCAASTDEAEQWASAIQASVAYALHSSLPLGWDIQAMLGTSTSRKRLVHKDPLPETAVSRCQELLDHCYICKRTKDRRGRVVPLRLHLLEIVRVQNGAAWIDYTRSRQRIAAENSSDLQDSLEDIDQDNSLIQEPGFWSRGMSRQSADSTATDRDRGLKEVPIMTSTFRDWRLEQVLGGELSSAANEHWLFHGTSAAGVQGISDEEFRLNLAGSHRGTMYGHGVYLAESTTKADEYAEEDEDGYCYMLLCRAVLGKVMECADKSPPKDILETCKRAGFNSLCGDRWSAVGTYREFVLHEPNQIYPAFILRYKRWTEATFCRSIRAAGDEKDYASLSQLVLLCAILSDEYPDETVRFRLCLLLGASDLAIPELCRACTHKRIRVRRAAVLVILQLASNSLHNGDMSCLLGHIKMVVLALTRGLSDSCHEICLHSIKGLQKLSEHSGAAEPGLARCLQASSAEVREAAALALGDFGSISQDTMSELVSLTEDSEATVRSASLLALGSIGKLGGSMDVPAAIFRARLEDPSNEVRCSACTGLGILKKGQGAVAIPDLVARLKDEDMPTRKAAARALGSYGEASAIALAELTSCMKDAEDEVRQVTATSLKYLGIFAAPAQPALVTGLRDKSSKVRCACASALSRLWSRNQMANSAVVLALLGLGGFNESDRGEHLGLYKNREVSSQAKGVHAVIACGLSDMDDSVRAAAAESLADMASLGNIPEYMRHTVKSSMEGRLKDADECVRGFARNCLDHFANVRYHDSKYYHGERQQQEGTAGMVLF